MANYDQRIPVNNAFGQLSGGVDALATTLASAAFAALPVLTTASLDDYIPIVLADDSLGVFEIVWITGHSAASTTVTVARGREATPARQWGTGTLWRCAPTIREAVGQFTRAQLPADAHLGMRALVTDEGLVVEKTAAGFLASAGVANPADVGPRYDYGTQTFSNPPASAVLQMRAATPSGINTDAGGNATVYYRNPFPVATVAVLLTSTVGSAGDKALTGVYKDRFSFLAYGLNGAVLPNFAVGLYYLAIGY